jgi:hypothetical protein
MKYVVNVRIFEAMSGFLFSAVIINNITDTWTCEFGMTRVQLPKSNSHSIKSRT